MGAVFVGEHTRIKRVVAIKVLHASKPDLEATQRFEREAEAAGRIGSDHIVEVLDFGATPEGDRFMVMEFLNGETMKQRLKRSSPLAPVDVIPLLVQVLEGLAAAHDAGIIHRDLKPDNIFILREKAGRKDFVKLVDFGISKFNTLSGGAGGMTQTGAVMGTPFYMSPEQAKSANEVDARSDLYSVGVMLYEAVTGARPFQATTLTELLFKIVFEEPSHPTLLVPNLDSGLCAIIMKAFARDPADRFQSAREMQQALATWVPGRVGPSPMLNGASVVDSGAAPTARHAATAIIEPTPAPAVRGLVPGGASFHANGAASSQGNLGGTHISATQAQRPPRTWVDSASQSQPALPFVPAGPVGAGPGAPPAMAASLPMGNRPPMATSSPSLASAQTLDPQHTWNTQTPAKGRSTGLIVVAAVALLGASAGGAFLWMRAHADTDTRSATIKLPDTAAAAHTTEPEAEPTTTASPLKTAETTAARTTADHGAPPSTTTSASAAPTTSAEANVPVASSTAAPTAKPTSAVPVATRPGSTAKPAGTVSDLGY